MSALVTTDASLSQQTYKQQTPAADEWMHDSRLWTCLNAVVIIPNGLLGDAPHESNTEVHMQACQAEPGIRLDSVKRDTQKQAVPLQPLTTCSLTPAR